MNRFVFAKGPAAWLVLSLMLFLGPQVAAQSLAPVDVGALVNGFQDDFDGPSLDPNWMVSGASVFTVGNGFLHVTSANGDPNHLLYGLPGYDTTVQEVLARIRIDSFGSGDGVRGGVAVGVDPASSQGINYHFRNSDSEGQSGNHMAFLDDFRAWGPGQNFSWQAGTWYWLRLRQEPNASSQGGINDVLAKIWPADGSVPEPVTWQLTWDYVPGQSTRTGLAGITASSSGGLLEFDVDYVLIKAAGLPGIVVAPHSSSQIPVAIVSQPESATVNELAPVSFHAGVTGNPPPTLQWFQNDTALPGATAATLTLDATPLSAQDATFQLIAANTVSNLLRHATSSIVTLKVIADLQPPVLVGAQALGFGQVQVAFSEPIALPGATNPAHYAITSPQGPVTIHTIAPAGSSSNLVLTVDSLTEGVTYTLDVSDLTDRAAAANVIAAHSKTTFTASSYALGSVGTPTPAGSQVAVGNGYDLSGGGTDLGGTRDSFQFSYQRRDGDFDFKVRLDSLSLSDPWAKAGWVAREDLSPGARSAAVLATPSISGVFFQSRTTPGGLTTIGGSMPVDYPNTWLRLKRTGNVFTGFGGFDGQNWNPLGAVTLTVPVGLYVGFAVSSHDSNRLATAVFRDIGTVTGAGSAAPPQLAAPGPSSRRTGLAITEIMYHPAPTAAPGDVGGRLEFIELFNSKGEPQDLGGYQLDGGIHYTFPEGTVIPGGGFAVVAHSPADLESAHGINGVLGPYTDNLPNDQGTVRLLNQAGGLLLEVNYGSTSPWPVAADGAGHSLVLAQPSQGENNPLAWAASDAIGGSPGRQDPFTPDPLRAVVINEFLAHTGDATEDYIELYNYSNQPVDVSGCVLTDDPAKNRFVLPPGTILPARGFASYTQTVLGFSLDATGETILFKNPAGTRVLDAVRFEGQENRVATGRSPDGAGLFQRLSNPTPGAANAGIRADDIVINEIMYAPISLNADDQYVELHNRGHQNVDLGGWQWVAGIHYTFPSNVVVPPDGYIVVARNADRLRTLYPNLNATNLVGDFTGSLSGNGERLALAKPDPLVTTNYLGVIVTRQILVTVNEVTYGTGGRWGSWSHGGGSSLELVDPRADNRLAANWADSDESRKAPWTIISATGTIDGGSSAADELQLLLQGTGECLVDNVQVLNTAGQNLVANSTFETGATGWTAEGTEKTSGLENNEGYQSGRSYHLRAVEKGDNQVNRVRTPLTKTLAAGTTNVTIRAAVRWLKGDPDVLLRLRGNWLECAAELPAPAQPGTPGARNSRAVPNAPPAVSEVRHSPVLPAANQPILVRARIHDPDGIASVRLKYRLDPNTTYATVTMTDSGTAGDDAAGDGIFSAIIPGQPTGTLVAFYLEATDAASPGATARFPADAPVREALVRVGEVQPVGNFPTYRLWMTQATLNAWNNNSRLDNSYNDVTFVLGNERVIYNSGARFKGSPYISPGYCGAACGSCGYSIAFPADDLFLGEEELELDWPGGHGGESTALQEQMCYWIADRLNLPWSHRHTIRLHVNGVTDEARRTTFEAVVQPSGGFLREWSPGDSSGQLFKIERAFEFNDGGGVTVAPGPTLQNFTTTGGVKKREHYRWNWLFRAGSRRDDYSNIFALVDAANAPGPEPYASATSGLVDVEEWMGIFATEHIVVNFDAYGHEIGKNMYAYLPPGGRWQLFLFDMDWAMLAAPNYKSSYGPSSAPLFNAEDPTLTRMYAFPPFARAYWRAIQNAVNGPLNPLNCEPVIDAKSRSLFANGIVWCDGQPLTDATAVKTWFRLRRAYLQTQLATIAAPFSVNAIVTVTNGVGRVTGTAPVGVKSIAVNGAEWPVTWTSVTGWSAAVPLQPGANPLAVEGWDARGQALPGASNNVTAVFTGTVVSPVGNLVINEIMDHPALPGAEYVELYNNSTNRTFDLTGWKLHGLAYTFPPGASIGPGAHLVLAANRPAFAAAYGATHPVFDTFGGTLQADGETLTLVQPGAPGGPDQVVTRVRFDHTAPWPAGTDGTGSSLQLIDPLQDNGRVGNWAGGFPPLSRSPGAANTVRVQLAAFPTLWLNELQAENLTGITNHLGQRTPWLELYNSGAAPVALSGLSLATDYTRLDAWVFPPGTVIPPGGFKVIFADGQPQLTTATELHTSFSLSAGAGSLALSRLEAGQPRVLDYVDYTNLPPDQSYGSLPDGQPFDRQTFFRTTPGAPNGTATLRPPVTINEWMAANTRTLPNPVGGGFDDWFELYNAGDTGVDLSGFYLSDTTTNPFKFPIPAGHDIPPHGFLLVWADKQAVNGAGDLHANFHLSKGGSSIGLFAADGTAVDLVTFAAQSGDISQGRYPDGGAGIFPLFPSPRARNPPPGAAPVLSGVRLNGDQFVFTGPTNPGQRYQVEYADGFAGAAWQSYGPPISGDGEALHFTIDVTVTQRFFRVRLVP